MGTYYLCIQEKHVILKSTYVVGTQANAVKEAEAEARGLFEY